VSLRKPPLPSPRALSDDTVLSQYGRLDPKRATFRNGPRPDRETSQSMFIGACDVDQITRKVLGRPGQASDQVRHTTVGRLRAAGFVVTSTPGLRNPDHVSVAVPGNRVPWDHGEQERFDSCFE